MPRRARQEGPGAFHHVVSRSSTDVPLVIDDLDRVQFLDELRGVARDLGWQCLAYCVMSTHAHLVVRTAEPNLGTGMRRLQGRYASAHNRRHDRRGHLFGRRYWSRRIDRPHYLSCAALYTVLNPVAAGLCAHPSDFVWSSYRETVGVVPRTGLLEAEVLLRTFADDVSQAREAYRKVVDEALRRLAARRADELWWQAVQRAAPGVRSPGARTTGLSRSPPRRPLMCLAMCMRMHITLDDDLVRELDRRVGRGHRSAFIAATIKQALEDQRRWELIISAAGTIAAEGHQWDEDPAAWVRAERRTAAARVG